MVINSRALIWVSVFVLSGSHNIVSGSSIFVYDRTTGATTRVSVRSDGTEASGASWFPAISADGRFVAFESSADNLVNNDLNGRSDIFVHDRTTGQTTRVTLHSAGTEANDHSSFPAISGDGRFVAFRSWANNLVADDFNENTDVFVHDRTTGATARVSVRSDGTEVAGGILSSLSISGDGRFVAFEYWYNNLDPTLVDDDLNGLWDVFVHDRATGETTRASVRSDGTEVRNGGNRHPTISDDGRFVAFDSFASNLVDDDLNRTEDIFVHDRTTGETRRVSLASDGTEGNGWSYSPAISGDGRIVAFKSLADNLVDNDANRKADVFVHDRATGETTRVSVKSDGTEAKGGSWLLANSPPAISADGRFVAFESNANDLVDGDLNETVHIFVHDRATGETTRVSVKSDGTEANGHSKLPAMSADGRFVAFESDANNLGNL